MHIEVDQSGKINDTRVDTVLAFADGESYAVLIPASVKRECEYFLRTHFRNLHQPHMRMFAAALFRLLQNHLSKIDQVVIDTEYIGHEAAIKGQLLNYIRAVVPDFGSDRIIFRQIGRASPAHWKAYQAYVGDTRPERTITKEELIDLLRK